MSDLSDLQAVGEDLVPIFKRLFELPDLLADDNDTSAEAAVITRLRKVTTEANQPTGGDLLSRAEAVVSSREALTEIIIQANDRTKALEETRLRIVEAQHNALGASFGRLLEQSAFAAIPKLLDDGEITKISKTLADADQAISQRQTVKDILDLTVNIALTGAKIAVRLA